MTDDPYFWQDDPWGDQPSDRRRRWRRPWNNYLAIMIGFAGFIMLCGSFLFPGWHTVGALLVMCSPYAIARSDGPRPRPSRPHPPLPTRREELTWVAIALAMVVVGVVLFVR